MSVGALAGINLPTFLISTANMGKEVYHYNLRDNPSVISPNPIGDDSLMSSLERFSFFKRGDMSDVSEHIGNISQLHQKLTTNPAWKLTIETLRALPPAKISVEKEKLPAFTSSVVLLNGKREQKSAEFAHNHLIQADFDKSLDFDALYTSLCKDDHTRLIFRSPSNKVKALIKVAPVETKSDHKAAFQAVSAYCVERGYGEIDQLPKAINSLCYISFDPTAVLKDAIPLSWTPLPKKQSASSSESNAKPDVKALDFVSNDCDYETWRNVGMAIKEAGFDVEVFEKWSGGQRMRSTGEWIDADIPAQWHRFNGEGITWGTVVRLAKANDYKSDNGRTAPVEPVKDVELPQPLGGSPVVMLSEVNQVDDTPVVMPLARHVVSDDVASHLWTNDSIYRRGIFLGTLRRGEDAPVFVKSEILSIGGEISRACALQRHNKNGIPSTVANAPGWLCADILHNQAVDKAREVRVVVSHPFYNGDKLVTTEGYDSGTFTYLDSSFAVEMADHTPESDLELWKELLQDFPFEDDDIDFENAIGFMLTLIVRHGLQVGETVPLFDVTAAREGVGKSLLACTLSSAVMGYNMATDDLSSNREEIEKAVGGILLAGREAVVFDNVESDKPLDSGLLASIITQPKRSVRPLGTSQMAVIENCATFCCTGSNVEIKPELAKRMVAIRLADPGIPEKDRKVTIEGIQDYVLKHRERYLSALVRMVQRWIDAGKPEAENTHRMRQWSRVVRGIMEANGFGGSFLANADAVMLSASPEFQIWTIAFKEIVKQLGDMAVEGWTVKDVFHILSFEKEVYAHEKDVSDGKSFTRSAQGEGLLNELMGNATTDQARKVKLGQLLRSKAGAFYGGFKLIDTHKTYAGAKVYALEGQSDVTDSTPF